QGPDLALLATRSRAAQQGGGRRGGGADAERQAVVSDRRARDAARAAAGRAVGGRPRPHGPAWARDRRLRLAAPALRPRPGRAGELATRPRYRYRVADGWREVTWQTMAERVRAIAAGLIDLGVAPGDRVALLSNTRPEWMEIDFAILACGALTVPIYQSNLPA